jgi:hypothetical protein
VIGHEIGSCTGEELLRFVRTLGQHRYVASRLHLVHAFAIEAAAEGPESMGALKEAASWAKRALGSGAIDLSSKDERLYRRGSDAEVLAVLGAYWGPDHEAPRARLRQRLASIDVLPDETALPFDEATEDDMFPILVDAGWELLPIAQLDYERHRGAMQCFDDYEVARFEEESAVPPIVTLHELPVLGSVELLHAFEPETRTTRAPFVLWQQGHESYLDYVLRGILRAAKLERGGVA